MNDEILECNERIKELTARMILNSSYWGYLFSRVRRLPDTRIPSIMGVCPESDGTISLRYNPEYFKDTPNSTVEVILEHEGMHLLNKHIPRLLRLLYDTLDDRKKFEKSRIWNYAADCAVNQQMKAPETIDIMGKQASLLFPKLFKLPDGKVTEFYYDEMTKQREKQKQDQCKQCKEQKEKQDKQNGQGSPDDKKEQDQNGEGNSPEPGEGGEPSEQCGQGNSPENGDCPYAPGTEPCAYGVGTIDDHGNWDQLGPEADVSTIARKLENFTTEIVKESAKSFRGKLPAGIQQLIDEVLKPPSLPYYQIIRKLVKGSRLSKFKRSCTRINRKRTYVFAIDQLNVPEISPFPGKVRDYTFSVCVILDTSGSCSKEDFMEALSGVKNIIENDKHCKTTMIEIDVIIQKEYEIKKLSDIDFTIKGRGGTTLFPAFERSKKLESDITLCFTDGYCEDFNSMERAKLPKRIVWILSKGGSANAVNKTGYVIPLGDD